MAGGLIVSVFFYILVGSLPYDIKHLELAVVVIWCHINKTELVGLFLARSPSPLLVFYLHK